MENKNIHFTESSWSVLAVTRFVLAMIVFFGHLSEMIEPLPSGIDFIMLLGGKAAVIGFLLISGISVGYSYYKSSVGYFKRRFLRIYPLYFFAVLVAILLPFLIGSPFYTGNTTMKAAGVFTGLANFFFLQGFASITVSYNGPLWSLGVEVFLYMLVPLLIRMSRPVFYILLIISMASFLFIKGSYLYGFPLLIYAWPWLTGFLISARRDTKFLLPLLLVGGLIVFFSEKMPEELSWFTYTAVAALLLFTLYSKFQLSKMVIKVFNYLGEISYPLYLFHMPLYLLLYYMGIRNAWLFMGITFIAVLPLNYIFDKWLRVVFWVPVVNYIDNMITAGRLKIKKQNL